MNGKHSGKIEIFANNDAFSMSRYRVPSLLGNSDSRVVRTISRASFAIERIFYAAIYLSSSLFLPILKIRLPLS